ncbi:MAG: hypothetical protein AB1925_12445 [Actinomycetota bacterium]
MPGEFHFTGTAAQLLADGADPGNTQDEVALTGLRGQFIPNIARNKPIPYNGGLLWIPPRSFVIGDDGQFYEVLVDGSTAATPGITLTANDPDFDLSDPLQWRCVLDVYALGGRVIKLASWWFNAPEPGWTGTIAELTPVPGVGQTGTSRGERGKRSRLVQVQDGPPTLYRWQDEDGQFWGPTAEYIVTGVPGDMDDITDAKVIGKAVVRAASPADARAAMEAVGLSELTAVVNQTIASADTVKAAAAAAVTANMAGRNVLDAADPRIPMSLDSDTWIAAWTGQNGRIAIGIDAAGHTYLKFRDDVVIPRAPTDSGAYDLLYLITDIANRVAFSIANDGTVDIAKLTQRSIAAPIAAMLAAGTLAGQGSAILPASLPNAYGLMYAITDGGDRMPFYITADGTVVIQKLSSPGISGTAVADAVDIMTSGPNIVCVGDSLTAGAGGSGTTYPSVLAALVGNTRTVYNRGVGGETSWTIAARQAATPISAIPVGGSIPASGSVDLTLSTINGQTPAPLLQGGATEFGNVTFAGVQGAVTLVSGTYKFTRTTAGSAVAFNEPRAIIPADGVARRGDIYIIWVGQNNGSSTDMVARAKADAQALIQEMNVGAKRFLVMNRPSGNDTEDAEWHALFGRRYLSPRKLLVNYGLSEVGVTPTSQDTTDIAAGTVPTSLRSDAIHLNPNGYTALGRFIYRRLLEFGWV